MGVAVLSTLTGLREEIVDAINAAGIKAIHYVGENIVPPVAIVVPNEPYVSAPVGENTFRKPFSVSLQVLLIGPKATNKGIAERMDQMIETVLDALEDWDITEVTAPGETSIKGVVYGGAVVTLVQNISLDKEAN